MGASQIGEARISTTRKVGKFALTKKCLETSISGVQKHFSRGSRRKRSSENMQQMHRRTPRPKSDFNKVLKVVEKTSDGCVCEAICQNTKGQHQEFLSFFCNSLILNIGYRIMVPELCFLNHLIVSLYCFWYVNDALTSLIMYWFVSVHFFN